MNNKVLLITTKGCAGCAIAHKLVEEAIQMYRHPITFEEKDIDNVDEAFVRNNKIYDFPTVVLIKNDTVKFKFTGTRPSIVIHRWFKIHFG